MIEPLQLQPFDWLQSLGDDAVASICANASLQRVPAQRHAYESSSDPQYVYLLRSGVVRLYRANHHGGQVTLGYVQPFEMFGELALFSADSRQSFAVAVDDVSLVRIPKSTFVEAVRTNADALFAIAQQMERRFRDLESRVEDLVFRSARRRLARILLRLADNFSSSGRTDSVDLSLTHEELATLAGTSRPTVSIALGEFEDAGLDNPRTGQNLHSRSGGAAAGSGLSATALTRCCASCCAKGKYRIARYCLRSQTERNCFAGQRLCTKSPYPTPTNSCFPPARSSRQTWRVITSASRRICFRTWPTGR